MSYAKAIIDLASRQELANALPEGREIDQSQAPLYRVSFQAGGQSVQFFVYELLRNQNRWVGVVVGPRRFLARLKDRLPADGKVRELTKELYLSRKAQFENLGLVEELRNGRRAFKLPHVICGQSPWVDLEDDE